MDEEKLRPWNWCDRRCERCPLAIDCEVNVRVEEKKRDAERRGLDPDDPSVAMKMVADSFREAIELLAAALPEVEEEELEELSLEPSREGTELYEAGLRYVQAVDGLCAESSANETGLAAEARLVSMIMVGKAARLMHALPIERDAIGREDSVLTLLLINHLERQAAALVMALGAEKVSRLFGFRRARRELRRLLDLHLAAVDRSEEAFLARMVAAGRAPSPFCVALGPPLRAA